MTSAASMESTLEGKYPAKDHFERVLDYIKSKSSSVDEGLLFLEGQKTRMNEDNDQEAPFRQRRYFYYLTGCELPDCYVVYNIKTRKSTLFIPPVNPDDVVWSGLPLSEKDALAKYDVDKVLTSDKINSHLETTGTAYAIAEQVSSHIQLSQNSTGAIDLSILKEAIEECRVIKDAYEVALTRKANIISGDAHRAAMKAVKRTKNERELEALFLQHCIAHGCRHQAYSSIVASGTDASTLHYVRNDKPITSETLNLLLDAGGEYGCYAADITRTYPINGKFTPHSRSIYELVLKMQKECTSMLHAGAVWDDIHTRAHEIAIEGLLSLGVLKSTFSASDLLASRISTVFFPHGLGHYLGMDTHDTGGHANYSDPDPMFRYLRVRGKVPAGAIITVEPGIYFCRFMIEPALKDKERSKYIDADVLEEFWSVGGVRIEDNILVTEHGSENLTDVPREVDELEALINGD